MREGRIYPINADLISRPGPRIVDGLEALARIIHPELFPQPAGEGPVRIALRLPALVR